MGSLHSDGGDGSFTQAYGAMGVEEMLGRRQLPGSRLAVESIDGQPSGLRVGGREISCAAGGFIIGSRCVSRVKRRRGFACCFKVFGG